MERKHFEVDKTTAKETAGFIFEARKNFEDKREVLDTALFVNPFSQVTEICTQYLDVDNKKEMIKMLEEKIPEKAKNIYIPMIQRMSNKIQFHVSQIQYYIKDADCGAAHRIGSIIIEYTQHPDDLNKLIEMYKSQANEDLKTAINNKGITIDYQFIVNFLDNIDGNTELPEDTATNTNAETKKGNVAGQPEPNPEEKNQPAAGKSEQNPTP